MPQMPVVLSMPGMPDQLGLLLNQSMNAPAVTGAVEDKQEAPSHLSGWYDEWGRLWPAF